MRRIDLQRNVFSHPSESAPPECDIRVVSDSFGKGGTYQGHKVMSTSN